MQAVILPDDVLPAVVETVAQSLRLPYVAIDLADGADSFRVAAEQGTPIGNVHTETLTHHGAAVGRLRVSERGRDEPLEPADLELVRSLAREVGPAVQAVRLHQDLVRSRAEVVALREDERRRLRRENRDSTRLTAREDACDANDSSTPRKVQPRPDRSGTNLTASNVCSRMPAAVFSMTVRRCTARSPSSLFASGITMRPPGFR